MSNDCSCCGGEKEKITELPPPEMRQLVDKVYALLLRDLKIERERRRPLRVKPRRRW